MGEYYDLIMNPTKGLFSYCFNECWSNQLDQITKPYSDAMQLRIGNQLRPKLTCWGAAFNTNSPEEIDLAKTAEIAAYIEMLHKASIIIDDMIDNDEARHGKDSFHVEFGRDKATIFALVLLGKGLSGINAMFRGSNSSFQSVALFTNTIQHMATGALEELSLDSATRYDIAKIRNIIDMETITLIKNSFLLGYWSNSREKYESEKLITEIGNNCGYIFQILNDLEPFSSLKRNVAYKGGKNLDVNRDRKSIVAAYIFGAASRKERLALQTKSGGELQNLIIELYEKYAVFDEICGEARSLEKQTVDLISNLRHFSTCTACLDDFEAFVHEMIGVCFSKLG